MTRRSPLVIAPGDPAGIGPEVVCKALVAEPRPAVIIGDGAAVRARAARTGLELTGDVVELLEPDPSDEPVEIAALRLAVAACLDGRARALVTGPIRKARLAKRGFPHHGHTEFLGQLSGVDRPVMAFVGGRVRVALVTVHVPCATWRPDSRRIGSCTRSGPPTARCASTSAWRGRGSRCVARTRTPATRACSGTRISGSWRRRSRRPVPKASTRRAP